MLHRASVSMLRRMHPMVGSRFWRMSLRQFSRTKTIRRPPGLNLSCLGGGIAGLTFAAAGLFGWFDEWLNKWDKDVDIRVFNKELTRGGLSMSAFFGATLVVCYFRKKYPGSFHLLYTERDVARALRKYQPQEFTATTDKLLPARRHRLEMLKQSVCDVFKNRQAYHVVTGPHGVGKSLLAEQLAAELSSKGNDLCDDDLKNLGVVYWACVTKEADNTQGILDQFGDMLGEIGVASMAKNGKISYAELFRVLRKYLPKDRTILIIFDEVAKDMESLKEFQKQVRRISQLRDGLPRIKVMVFASDSYDFAKDQDESRYENRGRVINILGFTLKEMTEWIQNFLTTREVKLVNVPHETSAAESVDPQATIPQDDKVKEAGADGEKKEMRDLEKLASLILKHEWNMNEVEFVLESTTKPDPNDEKKNILEYADVAANLEYVLHVTYKWRKIDDKEMRSTLLRILGEVDPQVEGNGRVFYLQEQLEDGGMSVKQIEKLCKVDLAVEVRAKKDTQIFIHPQLYYFARNQPHRFDISKPSD